MDLKRSRKLYTHRKRLRVHAALKKARQLEARRLATRVKKLSSSANQDSLNQVCDCACTYV
jgi:hypothetical protein